MKKEHFFTVIFLLGSLITLCNNKLLSQNSNSVDSIVQGFKNKLYETGRDFIYYEYRDYYEYFILKDDSDSSISIYRVIYKGIHSAPRPYGIFPKNQIYWYTYNSLIDKFFPYFIENFDKLYNSEIDPPNSDKLHNPNNNLIQSHFSSNSFRLEVYLNGKKMVKKGDYLDLLCDNPILKSLIFIEREMLFFEFDKKGWMLSIDYSQSNKRKKKNYSRKRAK